MTAFAYPKMPKRFVELSSVGLAKSAIEYAVKRGYPSLIHGSAGHGKSVSLYHLSKQLGGTYCSINDPAKHVRGMYFLLLDSFGLYPRTNGGRQTTAIVADAVYEGLTERHRAFPDEFLIVDEIGELGMEGQKELLRMHEATGFPLVLSGNDEKLMQTHHRHSGLDQIVTRIGWRCRFPGLSKQDCEALGTAFNVEGPDAYKALIAFGRKRNVRDLYKLLDDAEHSSGGGVGIRLHHLKAAVLDLFGRDGLALFNHTA
jgi:hypothetical protein